MTNNFEPPWNIVAQGEIENCDCNANNLLGCLSENACNYNPDAVYDDGSCEYLSCSGCTDSLGCNYNENASFDDGSCDYSCYGCLDETACNYDPDASIEDNSLCEFPNECDSCEDDEELVQIIELPLGWSFFSTYLSPSDPSFEAVLVQSLIHI